MSVLEGQELPANSFDVPSEFFDEWERQNVALKSPLCLELYCQVETLDCLQ